MSIDEILDHVRGLHSVHVMQPRPGDGTPQIAWGDSFCYVLAEGEEPQGQPFATIVTKDYPDDTSFDLDRDGTFRLNLAVGKAVTAEVAAQVGGPVGSADEIQPHPTYGHLGWVCVADPQERSSARALELLDAAHDAALRRARLRWAR